MEQRDCFIDEEELNCYLDGEIEVDRKLRLNSHLLTCGSCSSQFEVAQSLKEALRKTCEDITAPPWLRDKIINRIREEKPVRESVFWESIKNLVSGKPMVPISVAASLVIILAGVLYIKGGFGSSNMPIIKTLVHEHYEYMVEEVDLGISSENPEELSGWISANLGLNISLPPINENFKPEGACGLEHDGLAFGYVYFDSGDKEVSLFLLDQKYDTLFGQRTVKLGDISLYCGTCTGMNYVLWEKNDLLCVLVADLPESLLVDIAHDLI